MTGTRVLQLLRLYRSRLRTYRVSLLWYHLVGVSISIASLATMFMIWSHGRTPIQTIQVGNAVVDVNEASRLIEQGDAWRERYASGHRTSQSIEARIQAIEKWLPADLDEKRLASTLAASCIEEGLTLVDLGEFRRQIGYRVGVVAVTCRVEGTWAGITRWLNGLESSELGIACSELVIRRGNPPYRNGQLASTSMLLECTATMSLRIPFAAPETVAAKLEVGGDRNAH